MYKKLLLFIFIIINIFVFTGCNSLKSKDSRFLISKQINGETKYGYIDNKGNEVIPPQFDFANITFNENIAVVGIKNNEKLYYGLINPEGQFVVRPDYDYIDYLPLKKNPDLIKVETENKYGYVNKKGNLLITPKYEFASEFKDGLAKAAIGGKFGYIDKNGDYVIQPKYEPFWNADKGNFKNGYTIVYDGHNNIVINKKGETFRKLPSDYNFIRDISNDKYSFETFIGNTYKKGLLNSFGVQILAPEYKDLSACFQDSCIIFSKGNEKYGVMDSSLNVIIPDIYDWGIHNRNGVIYAKENNTYYIFDIKGKLLGKTSLKICDGFSDGLILVKNESDLYGYIDKTGKVIISPKYNNAQSFRNGLAKVEEIKNGKRIEGYINKNEEYVWQQSVDE